MFTVLPSRESTMYLRIIYSYEENNVQIDLCKCPRSELSISKTVGNNVSVQSRCEIKQMVHIRAGTIGKYRLRYHKKFNN